MKAASKIAEALLAEGFVFRKQREPIALPLRALADAGGSAPAAQNGRPRNQERAQNNEPPGFGK